MTSDQEIFYDFCIFPLQLILLVLYFIYLLRTYSVICFPALSLWSRSISMAFNLILVGDSMNLERSCALIKGQEIKMRYNIVFLISYPFFLLGGGGWLVFPCTIDPILSTMSCLVQLSLFWQLTRFYYFFFCSLLGPATTSISQHQQNWLGRIFSFILGR